MKIYSNGLSHDYVSNAFDRLAGPSTALYLAAPFFDKHQSIVQAAREGKRVQLLIGMNAATSPEAVTAVHNVPNLSIRFLTRRFHAKIFLFDDTALLGSSNLTTAGFLLNREAVICLDQPGDITAVEEIRALFQELWSSASVVTDDTVQRFTRAHAGLRRGASDPDVEIERAVGRAEPLNAAVESRTQTRQRLFLRDLQRQVYEEYRPAFREVTELLRRHGFRRPELPGISIEHEINRFLNWLRLTHAPGEAWKEVSPRSPAERESVVLQYGKEWAATEHTCIPDDYLPLLETVQKTFNTRGAVVGSSKEELMEGLLGLHAFAERQRFTKGGRANLPGEFWSQNPDLNRVRSTLTYLLHGTGDLVERLHDVLYDPGRKLNMFGRYCALELYGTVKPGECPPLNGRTAKALRFIGFDVRAD